MNFDFLIETYETERLKTLTVWSSFRDEDLAFRPRADDPRGRTPHEQMVHQSLSEEFWFRRMLGIDVGGPPLPEVEQRLEFLRRYAQDSGNRLRRLRDQSESWWQEAVDFFGVKRSRAWVMTRRIAHSAHHRGQLTAMLRVLGREVYSTYGPTADTGGLMQNQAPTIYAYPDLESLLEGESAGGKKSRLPGPGNHSPTERP
ncbi:MAG: DinB family protein [Acidobacteriota bacterium]